MSTVLLVVHIMVATTMVVIILLQRSEGGALGMGGGSGFVTSRGAANLLTRTTAILALIFFLTSLALGILGTREKPTKTLEAPLTETQAPPTQEPAKTGAEAPKQEKVEQAPAKLPELKLPKPGSTGTSGGEPSNLQLPQAK